MATAITGCRFSAHPGRTECATISLKADFIGADLLLLEAQPANYAAGV